jgi:hypothetical protein
LYLSLNGTGPVQVTAEASGTRLSVSVAGATQVTPEALNEHVRAVGELAARLGWKFDSVEHAADLPGERAGLDGVGGLDGLDRLL